MTFFFPQSFEFAYMIFNFPLRRTMRPVFVFFTISLLFPSAAFGLYLLPHHRFCFDPFQPLDFPFRVRTSPFFSFPQLRSRGCLIRPPRFPSLCGIIHCHPLSLSLTSFSFSSAAPCKTVWFPCTPLFLLHVAIEL